MPKEKPPKKKNPIPEIAAAWGVGRPYVYKLVARGLDTSSVEAATAWRNANAKLGVGYRSKGPAPASTEGAASTSASQPDSQPIASKKAKTPISLESLEESLAMAIQVESLCAQAVIQNHQAAASQNYVNSYNKAHQNRVQTETAILKLQMQRKELISIDAARQIISRAWLPMLARLRSVARRVAAKANPSDDVLAEMMITEEIEQCIEESQAAYEQAC